jgi:hypothetical protein
VCRPRNVGRIVRRALILAVDPGAGRRVDRSVEEWIGGLDHPRVEPLAQVLEDGRVLEQVPSLTGVEEQIL